MALAITFALYAMDAEQRLAENAKPGIGIYLLLAFAGLGTFAFLSAPTWFYWAFSFAVVAVGWQIVTGLYGPTQRMF